MQGLGFRDWGLGFKLWGVPAQGLQQGFGSTDTEQSLMPQCRKCQQHDALTHGLCLRGCLRLLVLVLGLKALKV